MGDHPFEVAWRTRELDAWIQQLSPDVVLHSPMVSKPFRGHAAARRLFAALFEAFGELTIVAEFADAASCAFLWQADLGGRSIEGADFLRYDERGKIAEIRVLIRPLADIAVFAGAIGPPLAGQQNAARALLARLLTLPLRVLLTIADAVASRLIEAG